MFFPKSKNPRPVLSFFVGQQLVSCGVFFRDSSFGGGAGAVVSSLDFNRGGGLFLKNEDKSVSSGQTVFFP